MSESDARVRRSLTEEELEAWKRIPTAVLSDERAHAGVMMGIRPRFRALTLSTLESTQMTSLPFSAKHAPTTRPT